MDLRPCRTSPCPELRDRNLPELWGGVECTINRVGDSYFRQMERNGHLSRPEDLQMFADLGVTTLRYPVLWEQVAPAALTSPDWSWPDQRLQMLRELGIGAIVGLLHHGSGPRYTSLVDTDFPAKLARYAGMVARRYPWIKYFTPVNEPLTTARFSGLYGIWYPHGTDRRTFVRCLINQCMGTIAAMEGIREFIPDASLVITEDMGWTFSTPKLQYQARFENLRRWLSLDLLFGRIDRSHPFRCWLIRHGASEKELDYCQYRPVPPGIIGLNYYLTSDRMLDERLDLYPEDRWAWNGRQRYADVEAVRAWPEGILGHEELMRMTWERYETPVALTEVHLGCSREEQIRWFLEAWDAAVKLRREGIGVQAVTAWSLLGAYDWNLLLREQKGFYEPGVFDVRAPEPRATALAAMLRDISTKGRFVHPVSQDRGWWRRPERFFPLCGGAGGEGPEGETESSSDSSPLLITGKNGALGRAFARLCEIRGIPHMLLSRLEMDIASADSVSSAVGKYKPWAIVNTAGFVRIDQAEAECHSCFRDNAIGPMNLATACRAANIPLLTFSSHLVFDGSKRDPYVESDSPLPLGIYGMSKVFGERNVMKIFPEALVIRTSTFFGVWDPMGFVGTCIDHLVREKPFRAARDLIVSPTYIPDLVHTSLDLLLDGESGIWHVNNDGAISLAELAIACARWRKADECLVIPCRCVDLRLTARRPPFSAMSSERASILPPLEDALCRFFSECEDIPGLSQPALRGRTSSPFERY